MKRQIKPILSMAVAAAFVLSACSSPTPTPAPTVAPVATTDAGSPTEVATTGAGDVTAESTTDASATTEVMTDTGSLTDTPAMTSTEMAGTDTTGTPSADSTASADTTGTPSADSTASADTTGTPSADSTASADTTSTPSADSTSTADMDTTGTPSASGTSTAGMTDTTMTTATMDIVDTAIATGEFMSLTAALESAGLVESLRGEGPFTVFAPTDEAFAKLDSDTLDTLMDPANQAELARILTYHVVTGTVMADDVAGMTTAVTLEGSPITITVSGGEVMINDATVVMTDVVASNGVIHVIDTVLMPPDAKTP